MREAFHWDLIWSDVRALSFCTIGSKYFWSRIWILDALSFYKVIMILWRLEQIENISSICFWVRIQMRLQKDFASLCSTANSRSLRMTNANTLTTKSTSLSFKRNLKSRRVYFQMSNPLILYAKKPMALVE